MPRHNLVQGSFWRILSDALDIGRCRQHRFLVAPCVVAGVAPWLLTHGYGKPLTPQWLLVVMASLLILAGIAVLVHAFAKFALEGLGTPAPVAPTAKLVIGGIYRHVRNPMYVAVLSIIPGQVMLFGSWAVAAYGLVVGAAMVAFVKSYEEPTLEARYGPQYDAYRRAVPGWLPRLTPWNDKG